MAWVKRKDYSDPMWGPRPPRDPKGPRGPRVPKVKTIRPPKPPSPSGYKYVWEEGRGC